MCSQNDENEFETRPRGRLPFKYKVPFQIIENIYSRIVTRSSRVTIRE